MLLLYFKKINGSFLWQKQHGIWRQKIWVQIPDQVFTIPVNLGKSFNPPQMRIIAMSTPQSCCEEKWGKMNVDECGNILKVAQKKKKKPLQMLTLPLYHEQAPSKLVHACSVAQSCLTLCNPTDYSPLGSTVHGIFRARIPEWVAIFYFRGSSQPSDWTHLSFISCIDRRIFYHWHHLGSPPSKLSRWEKYNNFLLQKP